MSTPTTGFTGYIGNRPAEGMRERDSELLAEVGLRRPRFPEYVGPLVESFRAHEDDHVYDSKARR